MTACNANELCALGAGHGGDCSGRAPMNAKKKRGRPEGDPASDFERDGVTWRGLQCEACGKREKRKGVTAYAPSLVIDFPAGWTCFTIEDRGAIKTTRRVDACSDACLLPALKKSIAEIRRESFR